MIYFAKAKALKVPDKIAVAIYLDFENGKMGKVFGKWENGILDFGFLGNGKMGKVFGKWENGILDFWKMGKVFGKWENGFWIFAEMEFWILDFDSQKFLP